MTARYKNEGSGRSRLGLRMLRVPLVSLLVLVAVALVSVFPAAPADAQSAPTGKAFITNVFRGVHLGYDVTWRDYVDDDTRRDASVTGYDVQYREKDTTSWSDHPHSGTSWFARITGLTVGKTYEFRVRKKNATGAGPWSDIEEAVQSVHSRPSGIDPPMWIRVTPGNTKATFTWSAPSFTGGRTLGGYRISVREADPPAGSTFGTKNVMVSGAGTTSGEVTGLTNGREYIANMRAVDADNLLGSASDWLTFTPRASTRQVSFAQSSYSVAEGASVTLTVNVSPALTTESSVNVITASGGTTAASSDYSVTGLTGLSLTLPANATTATFTVAAVADTDVEDPDEKIEYVLEAVQNADYVVSGSGDTAVVTITDDLPSVTVSFGAATYSVAEGSSVTVTVTLSADPKRTVTIPITKSNQGGATSADYSGVPANVTFNTGETSKSITFAATSDSVDDDDESVTLGFGTFPSGVSAGTTSTTSVSITDDDPPADVDAAFEQSSYTVAEGSSVTVKVTLSVAPERSITIPITKSDQGGATSADYSGVPASLTFGASDTEKSITFAATSDSVDDDDESVTLGFGTFPSGVSAGTTSTTSISITDDDTAGVTVSQTMLTVQDGATTTYTVVLDSQPTANVVVAATSGTPARATVAPASRTFTTTNWNTPQTFTVTGVASGSSTIRHAATSTDPKYPSSLSIGSVAVAVNPDDTTLSALSFSFSADGGVTFPGSGKLTPEFDPATRTYTMEISPSATHVKFTPTANHPDATITVNAVATASGASSAAIPVGAGRVTVAVTPPSGVVESYVFVLSSGGGGAAGELGNAVWTAALVMRDLNGTFLGCSTMTQFAAGDRCDNTSTLSQDTFYFAGGRGWSATDTESRGDNDWRFSRQYGGVRISELHTKNEGANAPRTLVLTFTQDVPESLRNSLTLVFDGRSFPLRDGISPQSAPNSIQWSDTGIAQNEHADDQVVDVGLYLNPVGPSVTEWQPTMRARRINNSHAKAGCGSDVDCSDPVVFGGNRFSVNAPRYGGLRSYHVEELTVEFVARYGHSEIIRRVTLTVHEDELGYSTVSLNGMMLELTANRQSIQLPIRRQNRVGNTNTWVWGFESSDALAWGAYSTVGVRIIPVTTGLQTVRVYYDEMRNGQAVDGFVRWDVARPKPHATLGEALIAVIPGEFVSLYTREKAITTHARLLLRGDWPGSTIEYGKGAWDAPPASFTAVGADGLTGAIALSAEKSNTYVWVRVTNGDQVHTHLVIIDPPPRTFKVTPELRLTEGETGQVTVSLGSPATRGGVSFNVSAGYGDGGATAADVGEIVSTVTIPEGQRSASIAVPIVDDEAVEDDESFTVTVSHVGEPLWAVEPAKTGAATVTIDDNDEPPEGPEPWNIQVTPGDGTLTVTWNISSRAGYEDAEIWHVLRWSQEFGVWANPRDRRAVGKNDGLSVDPGVTSYTITGLKNGVATGVFIRSMVGYRTNMSERDGSSSKWVRTKGAHTTPVAPPNESPTVAGAIADAAIPNQSGTSQVSLWGVFSDADGDDLTVTADSSDDSVATVSVSADHSTLTVSAQARGTATVTVTADDGNGGTAQDSFTVTVKAAPVVASAIADVSELEIDATHDVSLSGVFSDADGDGLTVTAASSNTAVAQISTAIDASTGSVTAVTVTGVDEGTATMTVTAQDSDGNRVSDTFDVTVPAAQQQQQAVELPGPVTELTLTADGDKVVVRWTAPDVGSAPKGYIVHLKPEGGDRGSGKTKHPNAPKTQVTYNKLDAGQTYNVWVRARNSQGKGERVYATITLPTEESDDPPPGDA